MRPKHILSLAGAGVRLLLAPLLLAGTACYLLVGPDAIRNSAQQFLRGTLDSAASAMSADELARAQQELEQQRHDLKQVVGLRSDVRSQVFKLVKARMQFERDLADVQRELKAAVKNHRPGSARLASLETFASVDDERRLNRLLSEARVLKAQINEAEMKLTELTADLPRIDDRIQGIQGRIEATERDLQLRVEYLAGQESRSSLDALLQNLEERTPGY